MLFMLIILFFTLLTGVIVYVSKQLFSKCLPLSFTLSIVFLFMAQKIFHNFILGMILVGLINIIFMIFLLIKIIKKKDLTWFKKLYFSNGFYIFLFLTLFIIIYNNKNVVLIKFINIMKFSMVIPFISNENNNKKSILKSICFLMGIFILTILFDKLNFNNKIIYNYFPSFIVIYILGNILTNKVFTSYFNLLCISLALLLLLLTTQAAIPLYVMCALYFFSCVFYSKSNTKHPLLKIVVVLTAVFFPLMLYPSTTNYNVTHINYKHQKSEVKKLSYNDFNNIINKENITKLPIKISFLTCACISFITLCLISFFYRNYIKVARVVKLNIILTLGFCGCALLFWSNLLSVEIMKVVMSSYSIIVFTLILIIINDIIDKKLIAK